jgi:hypothetical protein
MNCETCKRAIPSPANRQRQVNELLSKLPVYHATLGSGLNQVGLQLEQCGFEVPNLYVSSSNQGRLHEEVGDSKWLTVDWYRMESGSYEIVAYVN